MKLISFARWTPHVAFLVGLYGWLAPRVGWPVWPGVVGVMVCMPGIVFLMIYRCGACKQIVYSPTNLHDMGKLQFILWGPPLDRCRRCGANLP